jgi:hypothetical protein
MSDRAEMLLRISYHAVCRYVERVLGILVEGEWESERAKAQCFAAAAGRTIEEVRDEILTPGIALAIRMGVSSVSNGHFEAKISQPRGVISTIQRPRGKSDRRLRLLSERELRDRHQRFARRMQKTLKPNHIQGEENAE